MNGFPICCTRDSRSAWIAVVGMLGLLQLPGTTRATESSGYTTVERLMESAQRAELAGDTARHLALLNAAVSVAPDHALARWQLGQIQVDGQWLAVEEAQRRAAANPKQGTYRELRSEHGGTPEGQLALARWCRNNDLTEESRFHWSSVLSVDPNYKEALRALGVRWHDGELMTRDQIKQSKSGAGGSMRATRHWAVEIAAWNRKLTKKNAGAPDEVLDEIRDIRDPQAIPAFERVTLDDDLSAEARYENVHQLSLAFVDALSAIPDHAATESLVRHAVNSPFPDVTAAATEWLRERPLHDVVPLLLEGLAAPIEASYRVDTSDDGSIHYTFTMYREGPVEDWSHRASRSIIQPGSPTAILANLAGGDLNNLIEPAAAAAATRTDMVSAASAGRSARRYEEEAAAAEMQIEQTNQATAATNARIIPVLTGVTDQKLGNEPRAWWDWWQDHTEYYRPGERPVNETQDYLTQYITPPPPQYECFARGTPVWTKTGPRPIESLELGELVLSQNVDTGELSYKPVIGRTVRPPSELLSISVGDETLRITRGHPVWVAGIGWQMAKELEDGAILHGVAGSPRLSVVKSSGQEEAFNLVVAEFNTYFVGKNGVLVHDNTQRRPTRAVLPGMVAK